MKKNKKLQQWLNHLSIDHFRIRLAHLDALPQLALLGVISGLCTGAIMVIFLTCLDHLTQTLLGTHAENYEHLPLGIRLAGPILGCTLLGLLLYFSPERWRAQGIGHVMERFSFNQGHMPWPNAIQQFFSVLIALASGLSAGREGPAVHMGAAISSFLGTRLRLPNNSLRILVGCGSAAAIGASFNTPIAGVIFAMEVIMAEYTLVGFTPIILASVTGTALSQWLLGQPILFITPPVELYSLAELPWVAASGIMIGILAALFIRIVGHLFLWQHKPLILRFALVMSVMLIVAAFLPTLMGTGYDLVNLSFTGELSLSLLLFLAVAKLLLTAVTFGLGVPVGIVGPLIVIGGLFGAAMGHIGSFLVDTRVSDISIYAMIGMAAMMSASLNAPLAALMALLELTNNPNIIMPGMLGVVSSILSCQYLLDREPSVFRYILALRGLDTRHTLISHTLSRAGVISVMNQRFIWSDNKTTPQTLRQQFRSRPVWILYRDSDSNQVCMMPVAEVISYLESRSESSPASLYLSEIPSEERLSTTAIDHRATLAQADQKIADLRNEALYVVDSREQPKGVITRQMIENYYR